MIRNTGSSRKTVRGSDLRDQTLGFGDPTSADKSMGQVKGVWATAKLTGGGAAPVSKEYDVVHGLGMIPTQCELSSVDPPGDAITASPSRKQNWSHSHVHMVVVCTRGTLEGRLATFRVMGG